MERRIPIELAVTVCVLLGLILQLTGGQPSADPTYPNLMRTARFAGHLAWFIAALLGKAP